MFVNLLYFRVDFTKYIFTLKVRHTKILIIFLYLNIGFFNHVYSQDPLFTQYYNAPLQINPAFAGNTYAPTIHLNSRVEWPSIQYAYNTASFSVDRFFEKYKFGAGLLLMMDDSGNGIYKRFRAEGIVSYRLKVNEGSYLKLGMSGAYGQNTLDWQKLVFGDQIDAKFGFELPDGTKLSSDEVRPTDLNIGYFDMSAGVLYYSKKLFLGIAVKHANTPINYYRESQDIVNRGLPVRFTMQVGGEFQLYTSRYESKSFYSPSLLFASQSGLYQLVFNNFIDFGSIFASFGYRYNKVNSDAVLFSVGVNKQMFKIAYSFDYTISSLSIGSGGSHEIGITINFDKSTLFNAPFKYSDCFNMFR